VTFYRRRGYSIDPKTDEIVRAGSRQVDDCKQPDVRHGAADPNDAQLQKQRQLCSVQIIDESK
jgi:hypothetical protein